jgi:hypothetical protein
LISPNAYARALHRNSEYGATIIFQSIVGSLPTDFAFDGYWRSRGLILVFAVALTVVLSWQNFLTTALTRLQGGGPITKPIATE